MALTRRRVIAQTAAATVLGSPAILRSRNAVADQGETSPVRKVHLGDRQPFPEVIAVPCLTTV